MGIVCTPEFSMQAVNSNLIFLIKNFSWIESSEIEREIASIFLLRFTGELLETSGICGKLIKKTTTAAAFAI